MNSFKTYLQSQGKSKSTIDYTAYYVLDFIAWLDKDGTEAENVNSKEVMSYLQHLQRKGLSDPTRAVRLNALNHFFDYQIQQELREEHPSKHIKLRGANQIKLCPILSKEDLEKIYMNYTIPDKEDANKNKNWFTKSRLSKQRNKVILSLLINQGLTTAEINRLQITDLRLKEGELEIKGSRKSDQRILKLKSNQIMDLMEYVYQIRPELLKYQEQEIEQLFLSTPTPSVSTVIVQKNTLSVWKGLIKELKTSYPMLINLRQIRTSVITHWLKQHNLREVQHMAGHRHVSTTERYLVNQVDDLLKDIDQYHPLN
jgi:integrase/recombinase XerD